MLRIILVFLAVIPAARAVDPQSATWLFTAVVWILAWILRRQAKRYLERVAAQDLEARRIARAWNWYAKSAPFDRKEQ